MKEYRLSQQQIVLYGGYLLAEERSPGTIEKYQQDTKAFACWLKGRPVTKETAAQWKSHLQDQGYAPVTINSMLAALNGLFRFLGWEDCRVKFLKIQRKLFRESSRELTRQEYDRLHTCADHLGRDRLALLMETICSTGIRVHQGLEPLHRVQHQRQRGGPLHRRERHGYCQRPRGAHPKVYRRKRPHQAWLWRPGCSIPGNRDSGIISSPAIYRRTPFKSCLPG